MWAVFLLSCSLSASSQHRSARPRVSLIHPPWSPSQISAHHQELQDEIFQDRDPELLHALSRVYWLRAQLEDPIVEGDLLKSRGAALECLLADFGFSSVVSAAGGRIQRKALRALEPTALHHACAAAASVSWGLWLRLYAPAGGGLDAEHLRLLALWAWNGDNSTQWSGYGVALAHSLSHEPTRSELDWIEKGCAHQLRVQPEEPMAVTGCLELLSEFFGPATIEKMLPLDSGEAYLESPWLMPRINRLYENAGGD